MKKLRSSSRWFSLLFGLVFLTQLGLQSTPSVDLYHVGDGTVCTCGCVKEDSMQEEESSQCRSGEFSLLCLCDQDHETRAEFPKSQIKDILLLATESLHVSDIFQYNISPLNSHFFLTFIKKIDHPPQV